MAGKQYRMTGPWRILPECPSPLWHNTLWSAARQPPGSRCICPHGLELLAARRAKQGAAQYRHARPVSKEPMQGRNYATPEHERNYREGVRAPDLSKGLCRDRAGQQIMDMAALPTEERPMGATAAAKSLCAKCPVRMECLGWAREAEFPAGEWGGIYGGKTANERRLIAKGAVTI